MLIKLMREFKNTGYYFVYIATNLEKAALYVGVAGDLKVRLAQLKRGIPYGHNKGRDSFNQMLYWEPYEDPIEALKRQKQLNGWSKRKKMSLVSSANPDCRSMNEAIIHGAGYEMKDIATPL